jgi:hypothetical protein
MLDVARRTLGSLALVLSILASGSIEARQQPDAQSQSQSQKRERPFIHRRIPKGGRTGALPFVRTELFFGTAKPNGVVSEEEFRTFVDTVVTPLFPDGLTVEKGDGQFRGEDDVVIKEESFVMILLYPFETFRDSSEKIEAIRGLYKEQFEQESVLRADDSFIVWVSF